MCILRQSSKTDYFTETNKSMCLKLNIQKTKIHCQSDLAAQHHTLPPTSQGHDAALVNVDHLPHLKADIEYRI